MADPDAGLRARLRAEGDLLDIVRGDAGGDFVLRVEAIGGRVTVEVVDWSTGARRQRFGRRASFVDAWRAAVAPETPPSLPKPLSGRF